MAAGLLYLEDLTAFCRADDEEVLLDFFSVDLNEVVVVVDFCTVWVVFLLTWRTSMASMLTPC